MKASTIIITALLMAGCTITSAQSHKRLEHQVELGAGISWTAPQGDPYNFGAAFSIGYGLDVRLNEALSVMPMIHARVTLEDGLVMCYFGSADGSSPDDFGMYDLSTALRWHIATDGYPIVLGIAPFVSYISLRDHYYIDADPTDLLNDKEKLRSLDLGLMPTIDLEIRPNFALGLKANIGLLDVARKYPSIREIAPRQLVSLEMKLSVRF